MHILLTDVLTCPRCGPRFGLIVLADRMDDRRVVAGRLGCANCREEYPVAGGVPDLRFPPGAEAGFGPAAAAGEEGALRLAALLGARERPGPLLLLGVARGTAAGVARLLPGSQVIAAAAPGEEGSAGGMEGVSALRVAARLPFRDRSLRGVAMAAPVAPELLDEAVRTLAPGAHLVLDPGPPGAAGELAARGLQVLLEEDGVVVASPSPAR